MRDNFILLSLVSLDGWTLDPLNRQAILKAWGQVADRFAKNTIGQRTARSPRDKIWDSTSKQD
jgi:hypothetical protein